jgi:hypothetical protein
MTIATAPVRTDILRIFNPFVGCPRGAGVLRLSRPVVFVGVRIPGARAGSKT